MKARFGIVETVYYQSGTDPPRSFSTRCAKLVESEEQIYERKLTVGEAWAPLEYGWLKDASLLRVHNGESDDLRMIPTPEEQEALDARVVEVANAGGAFAAIRPGTDARFEPVGDLRIRCRSGEARVTVVVFPR